MGAIIERLNGERIDLEAIGLKVVNFEPESLKPRYINQNVGENYIVIFDGYEVRSISLELSVIGTDMIDYALRRAELFDLLSTKEPFYIIDGVLLDRKWYVHSQGFDNTRVHTRSQISMTLLCINKYAEALGSTLNPKEWDVGLYAWNGAIDWDTNYQYSFMSNEFIINNGGTAPIDPRENMLNIALNGTFSSFLRITNRTTNEVFQYNGPITLQDGNFLIEGINSTFKGRNVFGDTNKRLITLAPGLNDILIEGGTIASINFDFKFLFK